jgi:MFS family permease
MAQLIIARTAGKQMAQVVSIAALPVLLAPLLGPVIAGAILQFASWRWLFLINLPVGVLALGLAAAFLPDDREETRPRGLDLIGLALLSPGLVLFLYGSDHLGERIGIGALAAAILMFALFYRNARAKGDAALIDLRLLKGKTFSASIAAMFMLNGVSFAGQMLIPIYLVRACGLSPSQTGWVLAPLGLGMMCTYPFMGRLTKRFGVRKLAACGALVSLAGTLPLIFLAGHGLVVAVLTASLFIRGMGVSAIGIPSITSGYASVARQDVPMATTAMNIVQRLGGPTMTTVCAAFLGWRLSATADVAATSGAFVAAFALLCGSHALLFLATLRLPLVVTHAEPGAGAD